MDFEEKKYWVGFNVFEGIGPQRFKLLYDFFGTAKDAFGASGDELGKVGLGGGLVQRFLEFRKSFDFDSYFLRLEKQGISVLCSEDENYPKLLKEIEGKPPLIYIKNDERGLKSPLRGLKSAKTNCVILSDSEESVLKKWKEDSSGDEPLQNDTNSIFEKKAIAVVGTRKVTGYGRQVTEMITEGLVDSGLVIVSGLARGVDEIAHETTIKCNGLTIAVLGCGLDLIYPPEHKDLAKRIVESGGILVSEFPLGMQAVPGNFPARNRIISGLSLGVVVTEAAEDSGSLITASDAAEQGREVFAVPGPITSPLSAGTSSLIKKGAKVVTSVDDIVEELGISKVACRGKRHSFVPLGGTSEGKDLGKDELQIVKLLENENLQIDEIARKLGIESGVAGGILSMLEIKGIVRNMGEGTYGLR